MKKTIVLNSVWVAVAVAAFVGGRAVEKSASESSAETSAESGKVASSRGGGSGSSGDNYSTSGSSQGRRGSGGNSGATVSAFQNENDALVANKLFADLLLELKPENARDVFDALIDKQKNGGEVGQQMGLLLEAWGKIDGEAAIAALADLGGDGRQRGFASISAMRGWASTNPEAAKAHVEASENGFEKAMLMQGFVSGLASSDPNAATEYVLKIDAEQRAEGDEGGRGDRWRGFAVDRQMESIVKAQMQRGMKEATTWAESLPDGSVKSAAFDRVAENYARTNPEEAAEWVKSHAGEEYAGRAVREIAEELAQKDPAAAASWASELPEANQAEAMRTTMDRWVRDDPTSAGEYLNTMTESPVRDVAVSSFARNVDREDPALAADWAGSIQDEKMRTETMESVARSWMRTNADEAKEWLPSSGLSEEAQKKVIDDAARGGGRGGRGGFGGFGR